MLTVFALYAIMGAFAGVLAGLLGIGGGLVIVPVMVFCLSWQGIGPEHLMHLALGTSMASIIFTSISSLIAHHKRGAVRWDVVKSIVPGILIGAFVGTCIASVLSTNFLKIFFVVFLYYVAAQMLFGKGPSAKRDLPKAVGMFSVGNIVGIVSSLVGIGGGTLTVPFMVFCNINLHHAIGTASAIGFPIAVAGTAGFLYNGWGVSGLPEMSAGFVYLPALLGIVMCSVCTAPLGVKLAHSLPVAKLKRVFALLLIVVASKMLWGIVV
ncbi:MAG: sulfite exporter TauE/SafE family protein [Desulfovibrio sp.]